MRKKNYKLLAFVLFAFFAAVAIKAELELRDGRRSAAQESTSQRLLLSYYIDSEEKFSRLPETSAEALVYVGTFDEGGFSASPIQPRKLKGESSVLPVFRVTRRDLTPDMIKEKIEAIADDWRAAGNHVGEIVFDLRAASAPTPDELAKLTRGLRKGLLRRHWLGVMLDSGWVSATPDGRRHLANAAKEVRTYYFDLHDEKAPASFMAESERTKVTFYIMTDRLPDLSELEKQYGGYTYFAGAVQR